MDMSFPDSEAEDCLAELAMGGLALSTSRPAIPMSTNYTYAGYDDYPSPSTSTPSFVSYSSSSGRSRQSSIFSNASHRSYDSNSSGAPPLDPALGPFDGWHATHVPARPSMVPRAGTGIPNMYLPCEFRWLSDCPAIFGPDELQEYMQHMSDQHLDWKFPRKTSCWWCDDFIFHAKAEGAAAHMFNMRMEHIRDHIVHDHYSLETHPRRQDFHMLDFLWQEKLITKTVYNREKSRKEIPCPEGIHAAGWRREPRESATRVIHDNNKEERLRRRQSRKGKEYRMKAT